MRKLATILSVAFAAMLVFCACDKDKDDFKIEEWEIASDVGVGTSWAGGFEPAYIIKKGQNGSWQPCIYSIGDFVYEKGYEYRLRVRIESSDMLEDGPSGRYTMLDVISRREVQTVDPEEYCPKFEVIVASELGEKTGSPFYWIKVPASGNPQWIPLDRPIEGFDYMPGYEYLLQVKVWADGAPGTESANIRYTLLETLGCEQMHSGGIPAAKRH